MITKKLNTHVYQNTKAITWLAQQCSKIQHRHVKGNIYMMGKASLEGPSSTEVSLELEYSNMQQEQETEQPQYL